MNTSKAIKDSPILGLKALGVGFIPDLLNATPRKSGYEVPQWWVNKAHLPNRASCLTPTGIPLQPNQRQQSFCQGQFGLANTPSQNKISRDRWTRSQLRIGQVQGNTSVLIQEPRL